MNTEQIYFESEGQGELTCLTHGGSYLRSSWTSLPNRKKYVTPISTWRRLDSLTVATYMAEFGYCCETCDYHARNAEQADFRARGTAQ
jgi:hypothetical protein